MIEGHATVLVPSGAVVVSVMDGIVAVGSGLSGMRS
jgi:hypothetical protein